MRKWRCIKLNDTDDINSKRWSVDSIYETEDDGYGLISDNRERVFIRADKFDYKKHGVKFIEIKEEEKKVNKFKVGDIVEIKDGNDIENYTAGWSQKMGGNIGKKAKISSIEERNGMPCYKLCDFNYEKYTQDCVYDERGLELVEYPKTKTLTITTSDTITTLSDGTHTTSINRYYTDKHDVKVAVNEVVKKYFDEVERENRPTKGKELIGMEIPKGTKFKVINIEPHDDADRVCMSEYIGKIGTFNYDFTFTKLGFGSIGTFDEDYMNAIDKKNGKLCWNYKEVEILWED